MKTACADMALNIRIYMEISPKTANTTWPTGCSKLSFSGSRLYYTKLKLIQYYNYIIAE